MSQLQPVNFNIAKLEKGDKPGFVHIDVIFNGENKVYSYYRKYGRDAGYRFAVVSGCRITFDDNFNLKGITREYDVKGQYRKSTESLSKRIKHKVKSEGYDIQSEVPQGGYFPDIDIEKVFGESEPEEIADAEWDKIEQEEKIKQMLKGEVKHEKYDQIKMCLDCNIPVYLAGPAGSGKNHTIEQIARENEWDFYFSNSIQQEYKLTGFIDAGGDYHETEFYKACTSNTECIFFLDEIDASIPDVLVLLNAAIANGYFEFPNGRVDFSHVHFVAAGNTVGSGADDMYTGRMVLDQATLDRFAIIEFNYSELIERKLTKDNQDLITFIHDLRDTSSKKGIRATFSYRCMMMVTKLEKVGMPLNQIMRIAVMKGLDQDTINTFKLYGTGKYYEALKDIQM
jgi:hypothetical protein